MNEEYVSFEAAKLLKEKGFDWACQAFYDKDRFLYISPVNTINAVKRLSRRGIIY